MDTSSAGKEKLRIYVRGTNRKYYLVPPAPAKHRPDYYVRFNVPRALRQANPKLPMTVYRSTGTNLLPAAKERGRAIIENVLEGRFEQSEQTKLASVSASIGEILDLYQPNPRDVKPEAAKRNRTALQLIIREVTEKENVRELRAHDVLTAALLRKWIQGRLARVRKADLLLQESAAVTINTTLAMARSVLSPKVSELYAELKLPDLTEFREVKRLRVDKDHSYKPLPQHCVAAIAADAKLLKRGQSALALAAGISPAEQVQVYRVYLLMSRLGLRNIEAFHARERWIERQGDRAEFVIERRGDFVAKNKRYGRLEIEPELLAELDEHRGLPDAWLISAPTATERLNLCHRKINRWLRPLMPADREKGAYELRKHAGSIIVSRPESEGGGIVAAAHFLRDTIATAEKHYASYLRKVRGIRSEEFSSSRAA